MHSMLQYKFFMLLGELGALVVVCVVVCTSDSLLANSKHPAVNLSIPDTQTHSLSVTQARHTITHTSRMCFVYIVLLWPVNSQHNSI